MSSGEASASTGEYHASAVLGGSTNGGLFAQAGTPDGGSASAGLAASAGFGGGQKSQADFGSGAESSAKSSAGTEIQAPPRKRRPDNFYDNVFNVSRSLCCLFKL
jgi:hypothetical protein